jgi:hypothetical protein
MATKYAITGGPTTLKIYPGGPHGFVNFGLVKGTSDEGEAALADTIEFINDVLAA